MNRLFKYILLLASVVCSFSCEKEIDLNEYTVTKIYYRTSDDKPITQSSSWNREFDSQILVDSYSADNGGCLLVYGKVTTFDAWFQYCSTLTEINIPSGIKYISEDAFYFCSSLTSITIPDSVTTIGQYAFAGCNSLISITIPDSVTTIGGSAFSGCDGLTSVTIGDSVTTIGNSAFFGCGLISITIPDSVTTIGGYAFYNCYSLTSVYCEATTEPSLDGSEVFDYNASGRTIYVPEESVRQYKIAAGWSEYADYIVGIDFSTTSIINYTTSDDQIINAHLPIISNTYSNGIGTIEFLGSIMPGRAFYKCSSLTSVTIPDSVTTIGEYAFDSCSSLTSITIPDSVTTIGKSAFNSCSSLTSVTIPDSVTTIGNFAFYNCYIIWKKFGY